jgi:hypothetical protein
MISFIQRKYLRSFGSLSWNVMFITWTHTPPKCTLKLSFSENKSDIFVQLLCQDDMKSSGHHVVCGCNISDSWQILSDRTCFRFSLSISSSGMTLYWTGRSDGSHMTWITERVTRVCKWCLIYFTSFISWRVSPKEQSSQTSLLFVQLFRPSFLPLFLLNFSLFYRQTVFCSVDSRFRFKKKERERNTKRETHYIEGDSTEQK